MEQQPHHLNFSQNRHCSTHPQRECYFLCSDLNRNDSIFKCLNCVVEQSITEQHLIPISQIIDENQRTTFSHWPFEGDQQILEQIRNISKKSSSDFQYREQISTYFKDLRVKVLSKIDQVQEKMENNVRNLWNQNSEIISQYNLIASRDALKKIVEDNSGDENSLSSQVRQIFVSTNQQLQSSKEKLLTSISNLSLQEMTIDFEGPNKLKNEILRNIENINMFLINQNDLSSTSASQPQKGNLDTILNLVSNKLNFVSSSYLKNLRDNLEKFRSLFDRMELGPVHLQSPVSLEGLSEDQLNDVSALANQISKLSIQNGEAYLSIPCPQEQIQRNSFALWQLLNRELLLSEQDRTAIKQLLAKYPIFEIPKLNLLSEIPQHWSFTRTKYEGSDHLLIQQEDSSVQIIQKQSLKGSAVSDCILDNQAVYQLSCTFNKPLDCNSIRIGLVPSKVIDSQLIGNNDPKSIYHSCSDSYTSGGQELIKGKYLNSHDIKSKVTRIDFQFCIDAQQFFYADDSRQNINKVQSQLIDNKESYRFGVGFSSPGEDWSVRISDIKILKRLSNAISF